jgi:hypothetical protein
MLKVDLHSHTSDDPLDPIPYSSCELIDRVAALGYDALAITLHDRQLDVGPLESYAAERGIVLIPGIERTIEGRHVLLLNFSSAVEGVSGFDDLVRLKRHEDGLVVAPHPYFPAAHSLFGRLTRYADLFDAVEYNAMYAVGLNFNLPAVRWARAHSKPLVGNSDAHRLPQLGATWSLVDAERHPASICRAIRAGRVQVVTRPLSRATVARVMASLLTTSSPAPRRTPALDSSVAG